MKDCKKGKRCFIVGNGLRIQSQDLEFLKKEDCFAANEIHAFAKVYQAEMDRTK